VVQGKKRPQRRGLVATNVRHQAARLASADSDVGAKTGLVPSLAQLPAVLGRPAP